MTSECSACGRFAVIDGLHIDRSLMDEFAGWAAEHALAPQDAIQLAIFGFLEVHACQPTPENGPCDPRLARPTGHGP